MVSGVNMRRRVQAAISTLTCQYDFRSTPYWGYIQYSTSKRRVPCWAFSAIERERESSEHMSRDQGELTILSLSRAHGIDTVGLCGGCCRVHSSV